jgi:3-oxoacyl-[acyl-carrier protein] reductase
MELKGVVALVTGGNGGLGQRICHAPRAGGRTCGCHVRSQPRPSGKRR